MSDHRSLISSGRDLEDSFFLEEDRALIERLKARRRMEEDRQALAHASGIRDQKVLDRLVELGVKPESVAPLALVPIVEVAWADGALDEKERKAVLKAAEARGISAGDLEHQLLEHWLDRRPEPHLLEAWEHYVTGLLPELAAEQQRALRRELIEQARSVAEASGGFLGLGNKVSSEEAAMLKRLEAAFVVK
jgi:hypothetical protein